ncbi:MAG: hypothetical protein GY906_14435 [bacterium]|nr:hypothetical protein [bacterium]
MMRLKSRASLFVVAIAAICLVGITTNADQPTRKYDPAGGLNKVTAGGEVTPPNPGKQAVNTLQYDNDTPFKRDAGTDQTIGNRFAVGVVDPHSMATITFRMAQNFGGGVVASIWDVNPASAMVLQRWYLSGIPSTTVTSFLATAPVPTAITGHSGSFIGGIHNTFYTAFGCDTSTALNGTCDGVALTAGTTDPGLGFHAVRIPLAGGVFSPPTMTVAGTGTAISPAANAIFRVTGSNLPVELMSFDVK